MQVHFSLMGKHPAINKGVEFYQQLHQQYKEKVRTHKQMAKARTTKESKKPDKKGLKMFKELSQQDKFDKFFFADLSNKSEQEVLLSRKQTDRQETPLANHPCPNLGFVLQIKQQSGESFITNKTFS
mmetsp:Transcript_9007/g.8402  ORF Transcript_9007/g.8402 Transcript_9007/m.8402 type:complete len:127 (+) Transcript_9007:1117-1497(+)